MKSTLERLRQRREEVEGGFTLIELLIVIVILGILAAIVVFAVQNLTGQSASAACKTDVKTVESAAEVYKAQTGAYPVHISDMVPTYLKEAPSTAHYTVNLGTGSVTSVPAGAVALTAFPTGTVVASPTANDTAGAATNYSAQGGAAFCTGLS
jgi:general secretion pathway protein G